jgi:hypothetical protein
MSAFMDSGIHLNKELNNDPLYLDELKVSKALPGGRGEKAFYPKLEVRCSWLNNDGTKFGYHFKKSIGKELAIHSSVD